MIFATVGTQLAFPRLIRILDDYAEKNPEKNIFAQVGPDYIKYKHMKCVEFMNSADTDKMFEAADLVVAHAGMGSIITAGIKGKRIIIFPRNHEFGEHRNGHQFSTAKHVSSLSHVSVAWNEDELISLLHKYSDANEVNLKMDQYAKNEFCENIRKIIF